MSSDYFSQFPKINYFNVIATNLTLRSVFIEKLKLNSSVFYPYVIREGETADGIATWYYGAPEFDWLIYFANNIIDPHTQWPKTYNQFENFIIKKYGSIEDAKSKIEFYRRVPDVSYISFDGSFFSNTSLASTEAVFNNTDIRITPTTYSLVQDQINYVPVYSYDYENELNEEKRNILMIDNKLKTSIVTELSDLLNG